MIERKVIKAFRLLSYSNSRLAKTGSQKLAGRRYVTSRTQLGVNPLFGGLIPHINLGVGPQMVDCIDDYIPFRFITPRFPLVICRLGSDDSRLTANMHR